MSEFSDESLIQEFLTESQEHLSSIEPDLLALEDAGGGELDQEIVNRIFRAIHSIKGAAGFFGFENLKSLSHVMESVLMRVRDKTLVPQPFVVEPLLQGVDKLRAMVDDIGQSETLDCKALSEELHHYIGSSTPYNKNAQSETGSLGSVAQPSLTTEAETGEAKVDLPFDFAEGELAQHIDQALMKGQHLFKITLPWAEEMTAKKRDWDGFLEAVGLLGSLLASNYEAPKKGKKPPETVVALVSSVLEEGLFPIGIDVEADRIQLLDPKALQPQPVVSLVETPAEAAPAEEESKPAEAALIPTATKAQTTSPSGEADTVRVRVDLLNKLMDLAGELVLSRNQLMRSISLDNSGKSEPQSAEKLGRIAQNVDMVTSQLQEHIMQTRMQPIDSVFRKFPRVVRDLANQVGKKIVLEMSGQDVELDKSILESLSDPLTHLIRNCCDHGLETPSERVAAGKVPQGKIVLKAYHEGGQINLVITDDGKGIDTARVGKKAIEKGLITKAQFDAMNHQEQLNLIFHAGLSTAESVSELSGRGVGMDVVRANIEKLGGHISLESTPGKGTTLTLQLPLTLAIIPSLVVEVSGQRFAIPQINLLELVRVPAAEIAQKIERVGRASVLRLRGKLLPLVRLADVLNIARQYTDPITHQLKPDRRYTIEDERLAGAHPEMLESHREQLESDYNILVLRVGTNQYGLIVDEVFDTEEIVVKPLSSYLKHIKCYSGTTIMGDGRVAMIMDATGIASVSKLSFSEVEAEEQRRLSQEEEALAKSKKQAVILFTNCPTERFALPLSSLLRLEKIKMSDIELVGNREFINYRGHSMALLRLEDFLPVRPGPHELEDGFIIVPKDGNGRAGIFASTILDTVEVDTALDQNMISQHELSGSAVVQNHMTLFIDAEALLQRAGVLMENVEAARSKGPTFSRNEALMEGAGYGF